MNLDAQAQQRPLAPNFPDFLSQPIIQQLAQEPRWTASGKLTTAANATKKAPINMRRLLETGKVSGATDLSCLVTLPEIVAAIPDIANSTFYLQANVDSVVVLDIEPSCPEQIKRKLLQLPAYYIETSMSGQGIHMIMPLPANWHEFPEAQAKQKLQQEQRFYEILLNHWCTFTRNRVLALPHAASPDLWVAQQTPPEHEPLNQVVWKWEDIFAQLASTVTAKAHADLEVSLEPPEIPYYNLIMQLVKNAVTGQQRKTLADFHDDYSRYEFYIMSLIYYKLENILATEKFAELTQWTTDHYIWLVYLISQEILDHREKHDQYRNDKPYLLWTAENLVAKSTPLEL